MKIGVFDHMDRAAVPLDQFFDERMQAGRGLRPRRVLRLSCGRASLDAVGRGAVTGRVARRDRARTKQLRFGPLVYLLPLYHPIKLLEEICMLDQISGGRLMLGVGRGISPIELRYYGLEPGRDTGDVRRGAGGHPAWTDLPDAELRRQVLQLS